MVDTTFTESFSATNRLAAARAATVVTLYRLPEDSRRDLTQEGLLELWRKRPAYDSQRGSWRTFSERVVANKMASLVRHMHSGRSGQFREDPLENLVGLAAPSNQTDLRTDVSRVLNGVSQFDRRVAVSLVDNTAIETSRRLGVARSTVNRAIGRLRIAFTDAGLRPRGAQRP